MLLLIAANSLSSPGETDEISLEMPIETPECVQMSYRLAGPAARIGAFVLDTLIQGAILLITAMFLMCVGASLPGFSAGLFLVLWFVVEWFYFSLSEGFFAGRTIGKRAMGLRVIEKYGYPLSLWSAIIRNLLRTADGIGIYGVGFVSMLMSKRFQRLGDLAAGTIVIQERQTFLPTEPIILETIKPLDRNEFSSFVPSERTLTLIDQLLSRRTNSQQRVPHEKGHELCRDLAVMLAEKMHYTGDWQQVRDYSMAFLARVYVTFLRQDLDDVEDSARRSTSPLPSAGVGIP